MYLIVSGYSVIFNTNDSFALISERISGIKVVITRFFNQFKIIEVELDTDIDKHLFES